MRKTRFSEEQIINILKGVEAGQTGAVARVCSCALAEAARAVRLLPRAHRQPTALPCGEYTRLGILLVALKLRRSSQDVSVPITPCTHPRLSEQDLLELVEDLVKQGILIRANP